MRMPCCVWLSVVLALTAAYGVAAEPFTISGTVTDAAGNPVPGAQVMAMVFDAQKHMVDFSINTGPDGAFTFQTEPIPGPSGQTRAQRSVLARKDGMAMAIGMGQAGVPLMLKLGDKPETRCAVLQDSEGKPIANAPLRFPYFSVLLSAGAGGQTVGVPLRGQGTELTTDVQGRLSFGGFAPGLAVTAGVLVDGYGSARLDIPDTTLVTVALKPQATISGRVLVNGRPQADVGVSAYVEAGAGAVATTATDGTYTLRNLNAGAVEVMAQAPEGIARTAEQKITVKMGQAVTGVDFSLSPGAVIRGKISDDTDGKPVASASVVAAGTEGPAGAGTRSKDDGTYELRIPPGSYSLTCRGPDLDYVGRSSADLAAGQMLTLKEGDVVEGKDFAIKAPRRLQIQVLLPDGRPATNAKVMELDGPASRQGMGIQREAVRPGGLFDWRVSRTTPQTDPWVYHPEPALIITDAEQNLAAMVSAKALPDPPTITLRPAATATVLVTDAQGQPLRNFAVSVGYPKGEQDWMQSEPVFPDETGLIRMTCLPVGIRLRVFPAPDLQRLMLSDSLRNPEFILNAGEVRQLSAIVVNPQGRSLNMFVGDVDGKPVKGAEVYAGDARTPVFTDAQGKVTLSKLPAQGKIMLLAVHPTQDLFAIETADPNAGTWPGLLVKPRGKATGILMLAQGGKPLAGRQVSCEIMRGPNWNWQLPRALVQRLGLEGPSQVTMTDAEGRWRQGNLIPGAEYRVVIWHTVSDTRREGAGSSGPFKVLGGEEEQDTGKMECNLPPGQ